MRFFKTIRHGMVVAISVFCTLFISPAFAQHPPAVQLGVMPTAETLGKGGYTTSFGLYQFQQKRLTPRPEQRVIIGNFEEQHPVELQIDTFLVPARLTYGIGEQLDLVLGATFSTGGVEKIVPDFFGEDLGLEGRRVYGQPVFDGVVGLKYNLKPEENDGMPSLSVGGEVGIGYTADNQLNSDNQFIDRTPADGFSFFGVYTYLVGSQRFGNLIKVHAAIGSYLSSKSVDTTDSFILNWQVGGELAFSEELWLVADYSREVPFSGVTLTDLIGVGFRYEISDAAAFNVGYISEPGFQFYLTFGGEKEGVRAPLTPEGGGDLLF